MNARFPLRFAAFRAALTSAVVALAACGAGGPPALTYVSLPPDPPGSLGVNQLGASGTVGFLSGIVPKAATAATVGLVSVDLPADSSVAATITINTKAGAASSVARATNVARRAVASNRQDRTAFGPASAVRAVAGPPPVGTQQTFFVGSTASRGGPAVSYASYPFTLVSTSAHTAVWVHDASLATFSPASSSFASDAEIAYASDTALIGAATYTDAAAGRSSSVPYCDSAGNPTGSGPRFAAPFAYVNVLVIDASTIGRTAGAEFLPDDTYAQGFLNCTTGSLRRQSNEGGFVVASLAPSANVHYEVRQVLAHQLAHLIQFVNQAIVLGRANAPPAAIQEGLAELARDASLGTTDIANVAEKTAPFLRRPQDYSVLGMTGAQGYDSPGNYGAAYLLMRYIADRHGYGFIKNDIQNDPLTGAKASFDTLAAAAGEPSFDGLFRDFAATLAASAVGYSAPPPYAFTSFQFGRTYQNVQTNDSGAATVTVPPVGVAATATFDANQSFAIYPGGVTLLALSNPIPAQQVYVTDTTKLLGLAGVIVSR
ncbi:MAG: hypothetical protein QOF71_3363 [Candidatus Eremiobacteraeota bacterium]|nr:hypothetical protein [Candidatus Eremiobacteraeota bacterium]